MDVTERHVMSVSRNRERTRETAKKMERQREGEIEREREEERRVMWVSCRNEACVFLVFGGGGER